MFVDEGAERQAVSEGRGHVGDGHIPVALALDPAPLLQRLHGGHPGAPSPNGSVCERSGAAEASLSFPLPPQSHWGKFTGLRVSAGSDEPWGAGGCACVCVGVSECVGITSRSPLKPANRVEVTPAKVDGDAAWVGFSPLCMPG